MIEGIETKIERTKRRKTIGLEIHPGPILKVLSPEFLSDEQISKALEGRKNWIYEKAGIISKVKEKKKKEFVSGESFLLMGVNYRLKVIKNVTSPITLKDNQLLVCVPGAVTENEKEEYIRESLIEWYKQEALVKLKDVLARYEKAFGVKASKLTIKDYKSSWGRCSPEGEISVNWRIIMAPISVINYVVAHEVCHLVYPDHSESFWKMLSLQINDMESKREWLVTSKNDLFVLD